MLLSDYYILFSEIYQLLYFHFSEYYRCFALFSKKAAFFSAAFFEDYFSVFRIIFHLCLRFSCNSLCSVQDACAGDFVVAEFLADCVEGGIEFTAFLLLFGIFEEGELFEIVFGKAGYGDTDQAEGLSFPGFAEELFGAAVDFICDIGRIWKFCLV